MESNTPLKFEEDGRSHTDSSDMNVWGYFQDDETGTIFYEVTWNYMILSISLMSNLPEKNAFSRLSVTCSKRKSMSNYLLKPII